MIKIDMEMQIPMPENCYQCKFGITGYVREHESRWGWKMKQYSHQCILTGKSMTSTKRNRFCPLIECEEEKAE